MSKHTEGPWSVKETKRHVFYILAPDATAVATVFNQSGQETQNAALIAAAPELLQACEEMLQSIHRQDGDNHVAALTGMAYAMAKAKGAL